MTAQSFHAQKEKEAIIINKIAQSVKANNFHKEVKAQTISLAEFAIERIYSMRKEVYFQLDKVDYAPEKYNHDSLEAKAAAEKVKESETLSFMKSNITKEIADIIDASLKMKPIGITGGNFDPFFKTKEFKDDENLYIEVVEELKIAILMDNEEVSINKEGNGETNENFVSKVKKAFSKK